MRILALTNLYPNPWQPHRAAFNRQQFGLLRSRHEVNVIAPISWIDELGARRAGKPALPTDRRLELDGLTVDHPRYLFPPKVFRGWYGHLFRRAVRPAFERALAEFRPDVIYTPWLYPDGWAAVQLARAADVPIVVKTVGSDVLLLDEYPARRARTVQALHAADGVIAVSRDLANRVVSFGVNPDKLRVIYDGVNKSLFQPGSRPEARARLGLGADETVLLTVGNLLPVKSQEVLIDACSQLGSNAGFKCYIAGQGPLKPQLERRIAERNLGGRVELIGGMPQDKLADWYRACDLFVLPSRSEGVPNVLLEAAACGARFVASRVGGIPEIAHVAPSRLVEPGSSTLLAEAINLALAGHFDPSAAPHGVRHVSETVQELSDTLEGVAERYRRTKSYGVRTSPRATPQVSAR